MRRKDKAGTDSDSLLREARVCRLGFSGDGAEDAERSERGFPYVVPLFFAWDGESLYVHCALEGEKLRRLARDERVCVEIDRFEGILPAARPCGVSARYRSLIALGRATPVDDVAEKRRALIALTTKYAGGDLAGRDFESREIERVAVLRIRLEQLSVKQSGLEQPPKQMEERK